MATIIKLYIGQETNFHYTRYYGFDKAHNGCYAEATSVFYIDTDIKLNLSELFVFSKFLISKGENFREGDGTPDISIDTSSIYTDLLDTLNRLSSAHRFERGNLNECIYKISQPFPSTSYSEYLDKCEPTDSSIDEQIESLQNEMIEIRRSIDPQLAALQKKRNELGINQLFSKLIHLSKAGIIDPYAKLPIEIYGKYSNYFRISSHNQLFVPKVSFGPSPIKLALSLGNSQALAELYQCNREENFGELAPALLDGGIETQEIIESCESFAIIKALSSGNLSILSKCKHLKDSILEICLLDIMYGSKWGLIKWFERKKWFNYFCKTRSISDVIDVKFWLFDRLDKLNQEINEYLEKNSITYTSYFNSFNEAEILNFKGNIDKNDSLKKSGWGISIVLDNDYIIQNNGSSIQLVTFDGIMYKSRNFDCSRYLAKGTKMRACIVSQYDLQNRNRSDYRSLYKIFG